MSETKRKLEAHLEQESQLPDEGDWYCKNCGYLSSSRVTYHETCDTCHTPVEFHTVDQQTEIERVEDINAQLTAENERLRGALRFYADRSNYKKTVEIDERPNGDLIAVTGRIVQFEGGHKARQALNKTAECGGDEDEQ